jgi:hypothetical protein
MVAVAGACVSAEAAPLLSARAVSFAAASAWAAAPRALGTAGLLRRPLVMLPDGARGAKTEASKVSFSHALVIAMGSTCCPLTLTCIDRLPPSAAKERAVRQD